MSGGGGSSNQTLTQQAPSWQLPYQQYGMNQAQAQYGNVNSPTQLVAPFSPQQNQAISGMTDLATNNPTARAANNWVTNTLNGSPAENPYLNSMFNQAADATQPRLASEFAGAGRNVVGSMPLRSDELNNLATSLYGGAYNTGVQQQETAAGLAPSAINASTGLQQDLFNTGQQVQNQAQQYIQAPQNFLNQYLSRVNGNLGTTQTQPMYFNQGLMGLGGASLGSSLGQTVGNYFGGNGGNWGSLLGTLGGGLLGALG